MTIRVGGPGVGLPYPANLYPSELNNAPADAPTNYIGLGGGDTVTLPAGDLYVDGGGYAVLQYLDPVTGIWRGAQPVNGAFIQVFGNQNVRLANLTGCPVAAIIANGGSGFAQATAQVTSNVGGSTWQAVVGGSLSVSTISVVGAGYTIPPVVFIPAPPPGAGVQATAHTTIASGTVASVVLDNRGAGYTTAPQAVILPSPMDPNYGSTLITQASVTLVLNAAQSGAITAALCTNSGAPLATLSALTLTAAGGAGAGATITPQVMQSVVSASVVAGGGGWGTATVPAGVTTTGGGGNTSTSAIVNPGVELTGYRPRQAQIAVTTSGAGAISAPVVLDSGLFLSAPTPVIIPGGTIPTTLASIALTMGAVNATVFIQPR